MNVPTPLLEGAWKGRSFGKLGPSPRDTNTRTTFAPATRGSLCVAFSGVMCEPGDDAGSGPALTRFRTGPGDSGR